MTRSNTTPRGMVWTMEAATLIRAMLNCEDAAELHDFVVNYAREFADAAERLESMTGN